MDRLRNRSDRTLQRRGARQDTCAASAAARLTSTAARQRSENPASQLSMRLQFVYEWHDLPSVEVGDDQLARPGSRGIVEDIADEACDDLIAASPMAVPAGARRDQHVSIGQVLRREWRDGGRQVGKETGLAHRRHHRDALEAAVAQDERLCAPQRVSPRAPLSTSLGQTSTAPAAAGARNVCRASTCGARRGSTRALARWRTGGRRAGRGRPGFLPARLRAPQGNRHIPTGRGLQPGFTWPEHHPIQARIMAP